MALLLKSPPPPPRLLFFRALSSARKAKESTRALVITMRLNCSSCNAQPVLVRWRVFAHSANARNWGACVHQADLIWFTPQEPTLALARENRSLSLLIFQ